MGGTDLLEEGLSQPFSQQTGAEGGGGVVECVCVCVCVGVWVDELSTC